MGRHSGYPHGGLVKGEVGGFSGSFLNSPHFQHWAEPHDRNSLHLNWHIPNPQEVDFIKALLNLCVADQLKLLEKPEKMRK